MNASLSNLPPLIRPETGPATCKSAPWAGRRLAVLKGGSASDPPIAESWEFSTLDGSESRALGRDLSSVLGCQLPFLAKLIDTAAALSIQVHPEDDPSIGRIGKEEAWVILDAAEGANVLAGVRSEVDDGTLRAAMQHAIANPDDDSVLINALQRIPVVRGMVILVPAGAVHSIGPGILLAEIQQPTDCTFRLFDYGSARPIQPKASQAAWRIDAQPEIWRPNDPIRPIQGRHLSLQIWGPGDAVLEADQALRLLIAVGEGVRVSTEDDACRDPAAMDHGELGLHLHGRLHVRVDDGSMLVTGTALPGNAGEAND